MKKGNYRAPSTEKRKRRRKKRRKKKKQQQKTKAWSATVWATCWLLLQLGANPASLCFSFFSSFFLGTFLLLWFFFFFPYKSLCSRSEIIRSPSDLCSSSYSFISFSFLLDLIITSYRCIGQNSPEKLEQKETVRTSKIGHDSQNCTVQLQFAKSLLFSHKAVLEAKKTTKLRDSQFFRSVRTIQSGFQNLAKRCLLAEKCLLNENVSIYWKCVYWKMKNHNCLCF